MEEHPLDEHPCPRAEVFRCKLIESFNLMDTLDESGAFSAPRYKSSDFKDDVKARILAKEHPNDLVQFISYFSSSKERNQVTDFERKLNLTANKARRIPSLKMLAAHVIENRCWNRLILILILTNSIVLGILGELKHWPESDVKNGVQYALEFFDYAALAIFCLEIILKLTYDFYGFWLNAWNVFDFVVTLSSLIPEVILAFSVGNNGGEDSQELLEKMVTTVKVFRIFRSLKMVSRFRQVRLLALAITKAFKAIALILLLLAMFAYIFAIGGVTIFSDSLRKREFIVSKENTTFTDETLRNHSYANSMGSLVGAFVTLFQLFTLDHWVDVYRDLGTTHQAPEALAGIYVILWICLGAFIFQNVFVGIMVNNFQNIRVELLAEVKQQQEIKQMVEDHDNFREMIANDIRKGFNSELSNRNVNSQIRLAPPQPRLSRSDDHALFVHNQLRLDTWATQVEHQMKALRLTEQETDWQQDTLFDYFRTLEEIQENLEERRDLLEYANRALLKMHNI